MARFLAKVPSGRPIEDAFDYLADFSTTAIWDPSVVSARRTSAAPVEEGATFEVAVVFFGTKTVIPYRILAYERPNRVVLLGETGLLRSYDEISFVQLESGCQVIYDAELEIKAPALLAPAACMADIALNALFQWSGARSEAGLRRALA